MWSVITKQVTLKAAHTDLRVSECWRFNAMSATMAIFLPTQTLDTETWVMISYIWNVK